MPKRETHATGFKASGKDRRYLRHCAELLLRGRAHNERVAGMWLDRWLDVHMHPLSTPDSTTAPTREESNAANTAATS